MDANSWRKLTSAVLAYVLLSLLASACGFASEFPPTATPKDSLAPTRPAVSNGTSIDGIKAIYTSAAATVAAQLTIVPPNLPGISSPFPTTTSSPTQNPACVAKDGSWSTPVGGNALSITFAIRDCRITAVFILGTIKGHWVTVSNNANEPINGSQFDFLYNFSDQDRYNLSGTFTTPTSATIQLVIFKGFMFTIGQPSPLSEDLIIHSTANP
jgi:hypothetical protein